MDKEWFEYTREELKVDVEKQKRVFMRMLERLENDGHCRRVFHELGMAIFDDDIFEEM